MTETITTNENQPKEEKIKRLIQRKIDELEKEFWNPSIPIGKMFKLGNSIDILKDLLKEIETL